MAQDITTIILLSGMIFCGTIILCVIIYYLFNMHELLAEWTPQPIEIPKITIYVDSIPEYTLSENQRAIEVNTRGNNIIENELSAIMVEVDILSDENER